jgi:hypothetical protein
MGEAPDDEETLRRELMGEDSAAVEAVGEALTAAPKRARKPRAEVDPPVEEAERLHPILSNAEVLEIRAKAADKLVAERKKAAAKQLEDETLSELRREQNLKTGEGVKDELVTVTLDLAEHSDRIVLDGKAYFHGRTYHDIPRHLADTLREIQARGWKHQDEVDGKDLVQQHRANRQFQMMAKGAPGGKTLSATTGAVH